MSPDRFRRESIIRKEEIIRLLALVIGLIGLTLLAKPVGAGLPSEIHVPVAGQLDRLND
jgi:hypothetical protein